MQADSPGSDVLIDHFNAIAQYMRQQQTDALRNFSYISAGSNSRLNRYNRAISNELDHLFYSAHSFADTGLRDAYTSGFRAVYGNTPFVLTPEHIATMQAISEQYRSRLNEMEQYVRNDTRRYFKEIRAKSAQAIMAKAGRNPELNLGIKTVEQDVRLPGGGGVATRRYAMDAYGKMQTQSAVQTSFNQGLVDAAKQNGLTWIEVDDGPECGWESHNDPERANGKLVTPDEAAGHLLAHPNCRRSFVPRPDLNGKSKKDVLSKGFSTGQKVAAVAATALAAGIGARVLFQVESEIVDPEAVAAQANILRIGNIYQKTFNRLVDNFHPLGAARSDADILPFYAKPPPGPIELPLAATGTEGGGGGLPSLAEAKAATYSGPPNLAGYKNSVMDWGEALLDKRVTLPELPDFVKQAVGLNQNDAIDLVEQKFQLFASWVRGTKIRDTAVDKGLAPVLNFQLKRKQWNELSFLQNYDQFSSAARFTWTKYGPRTTIDATDFIRGRVTFTKDGIRRSVTFNPRGNYRSLLALSQDGTLMGALRYVPNSIFRGIIETDDFGKITGNVRLVPKNFPFRAKLTFETPRPKDWQFVDGLVPGKDFVDLRSSATAARGFSLHDFSFREVYGQLSQMQLKDVSLEIDILKKTPFEISQIVKIPISQIRDSLDVLRATGLVYKDGAGWSGVFSWKPTFAVKQELQKVVQASGMKVMGNISFSKLNVPFSSLLPDMRAAGYFQGAKFQEILTSVRISGLSAIRDARDMEIFTDILNLPAAAWADFRESLTEVDARLVTFLRNNYHPGIKIGGKWIIHSGKIWEKGTPEWKWLDPGNVQDIVNGRIARLREELNLSASAGEITRGVNDADIIKGTLDAINDLVDRTTIQLAQKAAREAKKIVPGGLTHKKWLKTLADINPMDSQAVIERKLQDYVWVLRSSNLDSPTLLEGLDGINPGDLSIAAGQLVDKRVAKFSAELPDFGSTIYPWFNNVKGTLLGRIQIDMAQWGIPKLETLEEYVRVAYLRLRSVFGENNEVLDRIMGRMLYEIHDFTRKLRDGLAPIVNPELPTPDGILMQNRGTATEGILKKTTIEIDRGLYPQLYQDVVDTAAAYERAFPDMDPVTFKIGTLSDFAGKPGGISSMAFWQNDKIYVNPVAAKFWETGRLQASLVKLAQRGWFADTAQDPIYLLAHEMGHHVTVATWHEWAPSLREAVNEAFDTLNIEARTGTGEVWDLSPAAERYISHNISQYSLKPGLEEWFAETMAHAMTSSKISSVEEALIKKFLEVGGWNGRRFEVSQAGTVIDRWFEAMGVTVG